MRTAVKNVFVLGMDEENRKILERTPSARDCEFHQLLTQEELQFGQVDIEELLAKAERVLDEFEGSVDAIVGYWDFPVTLLVPILCAPRGLPSPSLESVVRCEHKYWSRLLQSEVVDAHPPFALVELDDPTPPENLSYPFWFKPVKSASSELAYRIEDEEAFRAAAERLREGVDRIGLPFEQILKRIDLPPEIAAAGGRTALAEGSLKGLQVAVEGYVYQGEPVVHGVLDSVDYPGSSTFLRHQYPSGLSDDVCRRLSDTAKRTVRKLGLDNSTFSVEFFYDPLEDELGIVEVNPRHSQAHAELFELVDGVANHERMLRLALGQDPALPANGTPTGYEVAAEWYLRRFDDGVTTRVPTEEEVAELEASLPGVTVKVVPQEGQRLSELPAQDSYSYELALITIGASDETEMTAKYERCVEELKFEFEDEDPLAETGGL